MHDVCDTELSSGGKRLSHRLLEIVKILNKGAVATCFTSKVCDTLTLGYIIHGSMFEHDHRLQGRVARALSHGIRDSAVTQEEQHFRNCPQNTCVGMSIALRRATAMAAKRNQGRGNDRKVFAQALVASHTEHCDDRSTLHGHERYCLQRLLRRVRIKTP